MGIAPGDQKKIYELFFTTKPSGKGTGLGLPICRNIVRKLGGDIHVESSSSEGATFVVRIPCSLTGKSRKHMVRIELDTD